MRRLVIIFRSSQRGPKSSRGGEDGGGQERGSPVPQEGGQSADLEGVGDVSGGGQVQVPGRVHAQVLQHEQPVAGFGAAQAQDGRMRRDAAPASDQEQEDRGPTRQVSCR